MTLSRSNPRARGRWLLLSAMVALLTVTIGSMVLAVHNLDFELESNAVDNTEIDWQSIYNAVQANPSADNPCAGLNADACAWDHDATGTTIFTTGGSKDDLNIPSWRHTAGSVPDKDEIEDAMAAMFTEDADNDGSVDDQVLYFAADRLAVNGAADFGFWFFKSEVSLKPDGTFSGVHSVGDLLLLSTFTNGGADTTIRAFVWDPANATINGVLRNPGVTLTDCSDTIGFDNGCGAVNDSGTLGADSKGNIASPWTYQTKSTKVGANLLPPGSFFEGGINLSAFNLEGCFSSFLAETRSSPSIDATLKDFVSGTFAPCQSSTVTTPQNSGGTGISQSSISIGTSGSVQVKDRAVVTGSGTATAPTPTGKVKFFICGPTASSTDLCTTGGTQVGTPAEGEDLVATGNPSEAAATSDLHTITSAGRYCFRADYTGDGNYPATDGVASSDSALTECFTVTPVIPELSTDATADPPTGLPLGSSLDDTATLGGTAKDPDGSNADGTITFKAYGPAANSTTCTEPPVYTSVVNVDGNGQYTASSGTGGTFTPTAPGFYNWIAVYSGDAPNTSTATGACGDTNEGSLIIQLNPTISTSQWVYPNDDATITVATGGGNLAGSVKFSLYDNAACTGSVLYEETRTLAGGALTETVSTTNGDGSGTGDAADQKVLTSGTYSWKVVYTSTNTGHTGATSECHDEHFSITFVNNDPSIPAP